MNAKEALERDWASLPPDVLNLIAKNLSEIFDFVRFRAVCTAWFSSTPITDYPPQFPWICVQSKNAPNLRFYSIPSDKLYSIHTPKFVGRDLFRLTEGYLPTMQNSQIFLLNPLANHEIPLPPYHFDSSQHIWFMHRINRMGKSLVLCGIGDQDITMIFCNVGQDNWRVLNLDPGIKYFDEFYLNDMLFLAEKESGVTKVIDIPTGALSYVVPPVKGYRWGGRVYLVETSGDIFRFFRHLSKSSFSSRSDLFDVHRLDASENGSPCWFEVKNIGNYAFFIDVNGGFVLKTNNLAGIKANSIYFIQCVNLGRSSELICEVRRIDIKTGAVEYLPFPFKSGYWFVPILHHL